MEYHDGASSLTIRHQTGEIRLDLQHLQRFHHSMKRKSLEAPLLRYLQTFARVAKLMDSIPLNVSYVRGSVEHARASAFLEIEPLVRWRRRIKDSFDLRLSIRIMTFRVRLETFCLLRTSVASGLFVNLTIVPWRFLELGSSEVD
jgi:hypothetical protein